MAERKPFPRPGQIDAVRTALHAPFARLRAAFAGPGCFHVVVPPRMLRTYEEIARELVRLLRRRGRASILHFVRRVESIRTRVGDRLIIYGAHRFPPLDPTPGVVTFGVRSEQDEPPGVEPDPESLYDAAERFLASCTAELAVNEGLAAEATRRGRPVAGVLPFGWVPAYEPRSPVPVEPKFDAAFLGRLSSRRAGILADLRGRFSMAPGTRGWGRGRTRFMLSAHIQLGLHHGEEPEVAGHRIALAFAHGCFLLSEPLSDESPFRAGEHYASARADDLPEAMAHYLAHPEERRRIAEAGRAFFRDEYAFEHAVDRLLPVLDETRLEAVGGRL